MDKRFPNIIEQHRDPSAFLERLEKINHKMEVLDEEAHVIPGLYAVGTDACSIYGDTYPFTLPGNTMGFCINSGRIAGENAAAKVSEF